jgi:hypothetical protein
MLQALAIPARTGSVDTTQQICGVLMVWRRSSTGAPITL